MQYFFGRHPGLLYGISALLGCYAAFSWNAFLLIPVSIPLLLLWRSDKNFALRILLASCIFFSSYLYVETHYHLPDIGQDAIFGVAEIEINSLTAVSTHFGKRWIYRGKILNFKSETVVGKNMPVSVTYMPTQERPRADQAYYIIGQLRQSSKGLYQFLPSKEYDWQPVEGSWGLAEWRYEAKKYSSDYIHRYIRDQKAATFLSGIVTGNFDDRQMQFEFSRFGLQHIMAISGFHFAIVASILGVLFRIFISKKHSIPFLIFLLTSYFVFLGTGASVMRAWIMVLIPLSGYLLERKGSGLNSVGIALLALLIYDPTMCLQIGFQFSFAVTVAILLLFPICDVALYSIFPKRRLNQMVIMNSLNQHAYCLLVFFRQAVALTIAVNLVAIPLVLFYFQTFPVLSTIYNLFFPFLVSVSMIFLIIGIILTALCPPLGKMIHSMNGSYTESILNLTYNLPTSLDINLTVSLVPLEGLICYISVLVIGAIYLKNILKRQNEAFREIAFI